MQIRVAHNQGTGNGQYQGEQDADPLNVTDCRNGSAGPPLEIFGDLAVTPGPKNKDVRIAALQVFRGAGSANG